MSLESSTLADLDLDLVPVLAPRSPVQRRSQQPASGLIDRTDSVHVHRKTLSAGRGQNSIHIANLKYTTTVSMAEVPADDEMRHEVHEDESRDEEEKYTVSVGCLRLECC